MCEDGIQMVAFHQGMHHTRRTHHRTPHHRQGPPMTAYHIEECPGPEFDINGSCEECLNQTWAVSWYLPEKACLHELPVVDDTFVDVPGTVEPGTEPPILFTCSDFNGLCADCLNMGCGWKNAEKECVDHCSWWGCLTLPRKDDRKLLRSRQVDRKLLSFMDHASEMCYDLNMEDRNWNLCEKAEGCETCVTTKLSTRDDWGFPDNSNPNAPTCKWFPDSNSCQPPGSGGIPFKFPAEKEVSECPRTIYLPMPSEDTTWPKLVGKSFEEAETFFSTTYGPTLEIVVISEGMSYTHDFVVTRVRLHVDEEGIIVEIPMIG